jgi:hypothetical protein
MLPLAEEATELHMRFQTKFDPLEIEFDVEFMLRGTDCIKVYAKLS